jgi:branched-chain amino acid aminotransferase
MLNIKIEKTSQPKTQPDPNELVFGAVFTDHMFVIDYEGSKGWYDPKIVPYQPISLEPSAMVFHYGQEMFEGMKAYKAKDGRILLFRPNKNIERTNRTNDRICIPQIKEEDMLEAIKALVDMDKNWIPAAEGTALYLRPFIIATDPYLGVRPSNTYKFMVIACPVGAYYKEGINPVKIWVETKYVRTVLGGVGEAKTGGNYAASIKAQMEAKERGYTQVLWLDGVERKYVEEVGTMNVFFKINGEVITPSLSGSILPGVTRDSVIELLKAWDIPVTERKISIDEVYEAHRKGELEEVFGTGTAAVISPVGELNYKGEKIIINNNVIGELSQRIYDTITGIQTGEVEDTFGWTVEV